MPEQLLTLEQVAEYLNVDKFTVYRLVSDKQLPAFKVGNQWRFKRRMIENWLNKHSNVRRVRFLVQPLFEIALTNFRSRSCLGLWCVERCDDDDRRTAPSWVVVPYPLIFSTNPLFLISFKTLPFNTRKDSGV